jgi:23S rRNA pseudouridine2605 synthase
MSRKPRDHNSKPETSVRTDQRLQKVLAGAGIGSRRECEALIVEGRVEVDRQAVTELGTRVDPNQQDIRVDGVALTRPKLAYYVVNKPVGVLCTNHDPSGRARVIDLIRSDDRLFTVGRLDRTSEGLILVTNDGELANLLAHPRYGVNKVYRVRVVGHPSPELLRKLREGIHLAEGVVKVAAVRLRRRFRDNSELEIVLREGRNREIRRLLARLGHKVTQLKRVALGPLQLGDLPLGAHRRLYASDVRALRQSILKSDTQRPKRRTSGHSPSSKASTPAAPSRAGQGGSSKRHSRSKQVAAPGVRGPQPTSSRSPGGAVLTYDEEPQNLEPQTGKRKRSSRKRR